MCQTAMYSFYLRVSSLEQTLFGSPGGIPHSFPPPAASGWPCNLALVKGASGRNFCSSAGLCKDVMSGVTAAILGHEVTTIKTKSPSAEAQGVKR